MPPATPVMRAKMRVETVERHAGGEKLKMHAVAASSYPEDGSDENNSYARWSPSASLEIFVANPALFGKINPDEEYYVDFIKAPEKAAEAAD